MIIVALALIVGASFPGGVGGVAALFVVSALLGATFGALSNGFGLIMRQEEALIGAVQFIVLPLTFLSIDVPGRQPDPAVDPARVGLQPGQLGGGGRSRRHRRATPTGGSSPPGPDSWSALLAVCLAFATSAFQSYQRSV